MTTNINPPDARRRLRVIQAIFAGAATIATLALFSAATPGHAESAVASESSVGNGGFATDDNTSTSNGGGDDYTPGNYSGGWVNNDFPSVDPPPPPPPSPAS
jgi:uncharacterized membrane protein